MRATTPPLWFRVLAGAVHAVIGSCSQVHGRLLDVLDRKVAAPTLMRLRLHLRLCPPCQRYLSKYLVGVDYARASLDEPPPPDAAEQTMRFVKQRAKT
jgi:hypothetical protein